MTPALRSEVDQCKQRLKEEREAEAKADDLKKERLQILQQSGGVPWPPTRQERKVGEDEQRKCSIFKNIVTS